MIHKKTLILWLVLHIAHALKSCVNPCTYSNNVGAGTAFQIALSPKLEEASMDLPGYYSPYKYGVTYGDTVIIQESFSGGTGDCQVSSSTMNYWDYQGYLATGELTANLDTSKTLTVWLGPFPGIWLQYSSELGGWVWAGACSELLVVTH